ncbi:hypothetical protein R1sor_006843 [Riccia sorocarpa]|uniref:Uncharacterized protein n=1 Tax=Riccia sorocarpa TaxID=122646 RepID=A0ABD3HS76_9MARC
MKKNLRFRDRLQARPLSEYTLPPPLPSSRPDHPALIVHGGVYPAGFSTRSSGLSPAFTGGTEQFQAVSSLRRSKRTARQQRILPPPPEIQEPVTKLALADDGAEACPPNCRVPPQSIRHIGRWKKPAAIGNHLAIPKLVDHHELPILKPPTGRKGAGHAYVTRSLFRDSSEVGRVPAIVPKVVSARLPIIGVSIDVFPTSDLVNCTKCDSEFLCCFLVDEYVDDVIFLEKVRVQLMHSEKIFDTF